MEPKYDDYLFSYPHDNHQWSFTLKATDMEDAAARLAAIQNWGKLDGGPAFTVPYSLGWFAKLYVAWQNFWRAK